MITNNIVIKETEQDDFSLNAKANERIVSFSITNLPTLVLLNVRTLFHQYNLSLSLNASDLLDFAVAVYSIDQTVSRKTYGFQGWSRHLKLYFPVGNVTAWNNIGRDIAQMLSFLNGDKWELFFRQQFYERAVPDTQEANNNSITKVSLFSGGLDSFIAAIDLLENNEKVAFVSHYKNGTERPKQSKLYSLLSERYRENEFLKYQFYVQPNQKHEAASKEDSSRARSFLFLVLGVCVANAHGSNVEFIIPENGLISLNVPLTQTRLSSHSTRTTHPHYLSAFKNVIHALGIQNPIRNPYQFKTKGEMMIHCFNVPFLQQTYLETLSCSHPDNSRFVKGTKPGVHCGYCVPCLIRQAAEHAGGGIKTVYAHQIKTNPPLPITKKGRDLRAFKMAIEEVHGKPHHSLMLRVLRSGPLPFEDQSELNNYVDVYKRGMQEVKLFLD